MQGTLEEQSAAAGGRMLAARVLVRGVTDAHAALSREAEKYRNEIRARASELDGVWVEKVQLATRPRVDLAALMDRDDPDRR